MEQSTTIDIAAPPARVWEVLSDVERWPDWTDTVRWVRRIDDGPLRTGSTAKISQPKIPTVDYVVTELEPGTSFTWVSGGGAARTTASHVIAPLPGGGTRVTLAVRQEGWLGSTVGRLYRGLTDRYLKGEAAGLKVRSEA
ncbi:hypothetical protein GCM10009867_08170 [Pedococcus aerophilus]|uniref:Polyketide cyclase n=1 Tax=Pedococcus aerophilus TaxID=436356 RepID=A0ABN3UI59_9MICO